MGITINDVAKRAGVSHTTVSWVIHDDPRITQETKAKVNKAIEELDYHPNYLARSLVRGKTNTIAVVASFFSSPFEMEVLKGIEQCIAREDSPRSINLFSAMENSEKVLKEIVQGKRADACILLSIRPEEKTVRLYEKNKIPLIVIDEESSGAVAMKLDNFHGAYTATEYMIARGCKRLGIIVGCNGEDPGLSQSERERGFRKALEAHGLVWNPSLRFEIEDYYFEEGRDVLKAIRKNGLEIDGLFSAAGDMVAMGVMLEARNGGLEMPGELSIVGYDDLPSSALVYPALTTVKQPLMQVGEQAYRKAVELLSGKAAKTMEWVFEPQLVKRDSV